MTKTELSDALAQEHQISKVIAADIINSIFDPKVGLIARALRDNKGKNKLAIVGFGSLESRQRAARNGRNPSDGTVVRIPAKKAVVFVPGATLKETVNS